MAVKIGLEVHMQLNTKTKLFCGCPTHAEMPNSAICPICLGHPGSKPMLNKKAVTYAMKLALALNSEINTSMFFSRKTYFYPDLAKNFQITQYELPLAKGGHIELENGKKISIERLHIEEDPASLIHGGGGSLVDYNRSGIALGEMVTAPELESPDEAREFMKKLLGILVYLEIFDENNGVVKADANISIEESGYERVEIKNITGFKEIERALQYEIKRQTKAVEENEKIVRETRGWNAEKGITYSMRSKEEEADYGYIAEPDLPKVVIGADWLEEVQQTIPELPAEKAQRWVKEHSIDETDAKIIAAEPAVAKLFEQAKEVNAKLAAKWTRREVLRVLNLHKKELGETPITADRLKELLNMLKEGAITDKIGQQLLERMVHYPIWPKQTVAEEGLAAVSDGLQTICEQVIKENPKAVQDYKAGEEKAFEFLIGKVMAATKGKAVPAKAREALKEIL